MTRSLTASIRNVLAAVLALLVLSTASAQSDMSERIMRGVDWLNTQVQQNGSLANEALSIATPLQNRSEAVHALKLGATVPPQLLESLENDLEQNTEYLSRRIVAMALGSRNTSTLLSELVSSQNPDGGFGGAPGYDSNPVDTAYALLALHAAGTSTEPVPDALTYLLSSQNADGGFSLTGNGPNVFVTALASHALQRNSSSGAVIEAVVKANNWLLSMQQADGGWGTVTATSLVYLALLGTNSDTNLHNLIRNAILSGQAPDGSWSGDPFITALALRALMAKAVSLQTTGNVIGQVVDGTTNQSFAGATVTLDEIPGAKSTTGADGRFALSNINAGRYTVTISSPGYALKKLVITLQAGATANLGALVLAPSTTSGIIQGVVTDASNGAPIAGATVSVAGSETASVITHTDGSYKLTNLTPGAVTVNASKSGYATAGGTGTVVAGSVLMFSPSLKPQSGTGSIAGRVVDATTQAPLGGVSISIEGTGLVTRTGADGSFTINAVPAGTVLTTFSLSGYRSRSVAAVVNGGGLTNFQTIVLDKDGSPSTNAAVSGVIRDSATQQPLASALITVTGTGTVSATTQVDGSFNITGVSPGAVTVTATKTGYESVAGSATLAAGTTLIFSPTLKATEGGSITGQVVDALDRKALTGVNVTVGSAGSALTDASGRFTIKAVPAGSHVVAVSMAGYVTKSLSVFVSDGAVSNLQVIELKKNLGSVVLTGKVADLATNQPIAKALVSVLGTGMSALTDDAGMYRVEGIATGAITVRFSAQGYTSDTMTLAFEESGEYVVDRPLKAGQGSELGMTVNPDKQNYPAHGKVGFGIDVHNNGGQSTKGTIGITIMNGNGNVIGATEATYLDENGNVQRVFEFHPGSTPVTVNWDTVAHPPGTYTVVARLYQSDGGETTAGLIELAQRQSSFVIDPTQAILSASLTPLPAYTNLDAVEQIGFRLDLVNRSNVATDTEFTYELRTPAESLIYASKVTVQLNPSESSKSVLLQGFEFKFDQSGLYTTSMMVSGGTAPGAIDLKAISVAPSTRIDPKREVAPFVITPDGDKRIRVEIRLQGVEQK